MWVEDLVRPDVNITAEISNDDANNFVKLCQMFYSHAPKVNSMNNLPRSIPTANFSQNADIFSLIKKEIADMSQPSFIEFRRRSEVEVISLLTKYIQQFNASLEILVFGSSHYGIKGSNTNLNLLINTRMFYDLYNLQCLFNCDQSKRVQVLFSDDERPKEVCQRFFYKLEKTDIRLHFKQIFKVGADRVLRRQIHLVHIRTGIQCSLLFESDTTIVESSEIISRFVNKEPMCK